jgi:monoamine oxidase
MPTLYTALRAQHRHKISAAKTHIPRAPKRFRFVGNKAILQTQQVLLSTAARGIPAKASKQQRPKRKIAIVGGGLAGLCAAYELRGLKYDVAVYEVQNRVGGRVHSLPDFIKKKVVEGGGELIGSNHPLWNSYRHHFRLEFSDVKDYGNSPVRFGKHTLTFEESLDLTDELEKQLKALAELAESIVDPFEPWTNRNARQLDSVSLGSWVNNAKCSRRCKTALKGMLAADNGIPANEQSLLAVLAMIKGGGLDRFWTDTELFRCRGGNQQLAEKFKEALNKKKKNIFEGAWVKEVQRKDGKALLKVVDKTGRPVKGSEKPVDDVILAIPPSVWDRIIFRDDELRQKLQNPPAMGRNVKFLMRFDTRFWQQFSSSPTLSEDGPVDLTWETTEDDRKGQFAMVAFSGSDDAERCRRWPAKKRKGRYVAAMKTTYPDIGRQIRGSRFMDWPKEKWSMGSYYFPRVNEVTKWGPLWRAGHDGWLHFAGEHTAYAFMGYMEGALSSGYRLARRIAVRDGVLQA